VRRKNDNSIFRWGHTIVGMGFPLDYPVLLHRWARSGGYPRVR
jgi:hypothetical protein